MKNSSTNQKRPFRLILASASPRRRLLLRKLKTPFRVIPSHAPEDTARRTPAGMVQELALRKAESVARACQDPSAGRTLVLGADTIVVLGNRILGKPRDAQDAYRMLYRLSGSRHHVYTGVAVVEAGSKRRAVGHARSTVRVNKLDMETLLRLARKHLDKAGAYAIQARGDPIARVVQGDYDNVVGLPLKLVQKLLKRFRP